MRGCDPSAVESTEGIIPADDARSVVASARVSKPEARRPGVRPSSVVVRGSAGGDPAIAEPEDHP
jgi:hypothetical protein